MIVLGVRCSNSGYAFAVLNGTKSLPVVVEAGSVGCPAGFSRCESLKWFFQEMSDLLARHTVEGVAIKRYEGRAKGGRAYEDRVEYEGVALLAAGNAGVTRASKKASNTIAKDLGLKGRGRYLHTCLDTSPIAGFQGYDEKVQDSIRVAWSELG